MDELLQDNFPLMSLFGCNLRFELTFVFAGAVALLQLGLFIFCLFLLNKTDQQDGAQDGTGSYFLLLGVGLSASVGVIYMTHRIPSSDTKHGSLYEKIYVPFQKEVEHMLQDIKAVMCRELDERIDEVRMVYKVVGSFVKKDNTLVDLLVKANSRTYATMRQLTDGSNDIPNLEALADYFKHMTSDYKGHLKCQETDMNNEKRSLRLDLTKQPQTKPVPAMGESSVPLLESTDLENPAPEHVSTPMKERNQLISPRIKRTDSNNPLVLKRSRTQIERKIRKFVQKLETPTVLLQEGNPEKSTIDFVKPLQEELFHNRAIELAAIQTFFKHRDDINAGDGVAVYQSFLEIKHSEQDSKYIEELEKTRCHLESVCGKDAESCCDWKEKIKTGLDDDKSEVTDYCMRLCRCCLKSEGTVSNNDAIFESCRSTVKFRVALWTIIIAIAQIAYAFLLYMNSNGNLDGGYLVIPLGLTMLAIQAILLIPCYTDSDSEKSKKIMLNFMNKVYGEVVHETATNIAGLADQEKFMTELTDIKADNDKATESLKQFDLMFDQAFNFVLTLIASFQRPGNKGEYRMIRALVNPENATLSLTLEDTQKTSSQLIRIGHNQIPKAGDTDEWEKRAKRLKSELQELEVIQCRINTQCEDLNDYIETNQRYIGTSHEAYLDKNIAEREDCQIKLGEGQKEIDLINEEIVKCQKNLDKGKLKGGELENDPQDKPENDPHCQTETGATAEDAVKDM